MIVSVSAVVGKATCSGLVEPLSSGGADGLAAAGVLVRGGDVADAGVQPHGVVLGAHELELGAEHRGVGDRQQVRAFALDGAVERLDPGLVGRGGGAAEVLGDASMAMNLRVSRAIICEPLSLTASRIGVSPATCGDLRAHAGRIADENRCRCPHASSRRLSFTRGARTGTAPAAVATSRGW